MQAAIENEDQRRRVIEAIAECDRYIDREDKRNPILRPVDVQKHLDFCKAHKAKLQGMLS